ncbi:unnamed protein product [Lota lota]
MRNAAAVAAAAAAAAAFRHLQGSSVLASWPEAASPENRLCAAFSHPSAQRLTASLKAITTAAGLNDIEADSPAQLGESHTGSPTAEQQRPM